MYACLVGAPYASATYARCNRTNAPAPQRAREAWRSTAREHSAARCVVACLQRFLLRIRSQIGAHAPCDLLARQRAHLAHRDCCDFRQKRAQSVDIQKLAMTNTSQHAVQSALRDVQSAAGDDIAQLKAWQVLRDVVRSDLDQHSVREVFRECVQAPSEATHGTALALKPHLNSETVPKAVAAEIVRLGIASQLAPAASELLEFEQSRDKPATAPKRTSVVIEELNSAQDEALDVAWVLAGITARCTDAVISVPWADDSTDVRAQQLLQQLADAPGARGAAATCALPRSTHTGVPKYVKSDIGTAAAAETSMTRPARERSRRRSGGWGRCCSVPLPP